MILHLIWKILGCPFIWGLACGIKLECRLSELLPDQTTELKASFAYSKDQNYQVKLGILSPMTQVPSVHFAMNGFEGEVMPKLATIQKDQKGTDK